jgi:hypothetical protein
MTNNANKRIVLIRRALKIAFGGVCCKCAKIMCFYPLEFAHIQETKLKGKGRGRKERIWDVIKNPWCYMLMCKDCHKWFDKSELTIREFLDINVEPPKR